MSIRQNIPSTSHIVASRRFCVSGDVATVLATNSSLQAVAVTSADRAARTLARSPRHFLLHVEHRPQVIPVHVPATDIAVEMVHHRAALVGNESLQTPF